MCRISEKFNFSLKVRLLYSNSAILDIIKKWYLGGYYLISTTDEVGIKYEWLSLISDKCWFLCVYLIVRKGEFAFYVILMYSNIRLVVTLFFGKDNGFGNSNVDGSYDFLW